MTIGMIIHEKGPDAGKLIDEALCNEEKSCCPGTSLTLGFAAKLMGKSEELPALVKKLNELKRSEKILCERNGNKCSICGSYFGDGDSVCGNGHEEGAIYLIRV